MTREWKKDRYTDTYRKAGAGGPCSLRQKQYLLQDKPEPHGVYCVQREKGLANIVGSLCEVQSQRSRRGAAAVSLHTPVCVCERLYLHTLLSIRTRTRGRFCHPKPHPCGGSVAISVGSRHSHGHITNTHLGLHLFLPIYPGLPQLALNDVP